MHKKYVERYATKTIYTLLRSIYFMTAQLVAYLLNY